MIVRVPLGDDSYDVILGRGLLANLGALLAEHCPASRYAIATDSTVKPLYGDRVLAALDSPANILVSFPAGEWNKSRETWGELTDRLLAAGLDREAAIVALGGGVVGDVAGFVAATYLRGIPYVQAPTSLLAMIDSSVGGKTGVDTAVGKNLVGVFHQPCAVVADIDTLASLPPVQIAAGMAEAIKHGVISDPDYFHDLLARCESIVEGAPTALLSVVRRSVEIKAGVVGDDERDRGRRAILNFGHTIGHALEATLGYELLHGEAVAIGMLAEAQLGEQVGVTQPGTAEQIRNALETFRLPTEPPGDTEPERMWEVIQRDKKVRDGTVRFALLKCIGETARGPNGEWTVPVSDTAITRILGAFT